MKPHELMNELQYGESIEVECKKASNSLPKSVWETYSSFARYWWLPTGYKYPISIW